MNRVPGFAMFPCRPRSLPHVLIVGHHHAAVATGAHDLVLAEREGGGVAETAHASTIDRGPMGLRTIFDDLDVVLLGPFHDGRHVAWPAGQMDDDGRACTWRSGRLECCDGEILGVPIDIGEHGVACRSITQETEAMNERG